MADEFENVLRHTELFAHFPFEFESNFIRMQFGKDRSRPVNYTEFTQLLHVCLSCIVAVVIIIIIIVVIKVIYWPAYTASWTSQSVKI